MSGNLYHLAGLLSRLLGRPVSPLDATNTILSAIVIIAFIIGEAAYRIAMRNRHIAARDGEIYDTPRRLEGESTTPVRSREQAACALLDAALALMREEIPEGRLREIRDANASIADEADARPLVLLHQRVDDRGTLNVAVPGPFTQVVDLPLQTSVGKRAELLAALATYALTGQNGEDAALDYHRVNDYYSIQDGERPHLAKRPR